MSEARAGLFDGPLWLVGFRPFFTLAFVSAVFLPATWALVYSGALTLPDSLATVTQWHAHEMLFGYGWAVLGGFLLTASKNWVKIRGVHGPLLALGVLLWLVDRFAILMPASLLRTALLNAFGVYLVATIVWTLVRYRKQDTFSDNIFFVVGLPLFLVAKNLLVREDTWFQGFTLGIGLFRLAFTVMFERTITQFMKGAMNTVLPRRWWLDSAIKVSVLAAAFEGFLPQPVAAALLGVAGLLLFVRLCTWKPFIGLRTFGIGIMYVGYAGLVLHLALSALRYAGVWSGTGTVYLHTFNFFCMGLIIPAMLIRIAQGHTGRKILFTVSDRVAFALMGVGAFFRLIATQVWGDQYVTWIVLAAIGWSLCFAIIGARVVPFLWQARVDGRVH